MIRLDKRNVAWSLIDKTMCLLSYVDNRYIQLNKTAQFLLERIIANDGIVNQPDLVAQMIMKYPSAEQQAENDISHFITWLIEKKILIRE